MNESLPAWSLNSQVVYHAPDAVLVPILCLLTRLIPDFRFSRFRVQTGYESTRVVFWLAARVRTPARRSVLLLCHVLFSVSGSAHTVSTYTLFDFLAGICRPRHSANYCGSQTPSHVRVLASHGSPAVFLACVFVRSFEAGLCPALRGCPRCPYSSIRSFLRGSPSSH
jgi:hypothetical protein